MSRPKPQDQLFKKVFRCALSSCRKQKIAHRPNAKYCSDYCRVKACMIRTGRWNPKKGTEGGPVE